MEKWLKEIYNSIDIEKEKDLRKFRKKDFDLSMKITTGGQQFNFDMNYFNYIEKFFKQIKLLELSQNGIKNLLKTCNMKFKSDKLIKGYSGSEYWIQNYVNEKDRLIIITPAIFPCYLEALGFSNKSSFNAFLTFYVFEFFKYIDIINAQEKPTIMAFYGLTNFKEFEQVNFFDFIEEQIQKLNIPRNEEDIEKGLEENGLFGLNIKNIFDTYGIPRIDIKFKDVLRMAILNPKRSRDRRELVGYREEIGLLEFLNPTILDYPLYATYNSKIVEPNFIRKYLEKGKKLGHSPSKSKYLPNINPNKVINDPFDLMEYMEQKGYMVSSKGNYELTEDGLKLINLEVRSKPKEFSLKKVWNILTKAKRFIPFYKFI